MNNQLPRDSRILIAGHRGLVGSALVRKFRASGFINLILKSRTEYNLEIEEDVQMLFADERPDVVIVAAAKVGGILANNQLPFDFIEKNLRIELNLIGGAHRAGVDTLVFLGSSCIYPRMASQPIQEESLLAGPLEPTNRPYAVAKIAGIEMCWAINRQFGRNYFSVMPTNLYGTEDNFDLQTSHVLPALLKKFSLAKAANEQVVNVWGSGTPRREFLYSDDLAEAILFLLDKDADQLKFLFNESNAPLINVGSGSDVTIAELAELVRREIGFTGEIEFDKTKPDGTPRKLIDSSKIFNLGWRPSTTLEEGIRRVIQKHF